MIMLMLGWQSCGPGPLDARRADGHRWNLTHYQAPGGPVTGATRLEAWMALQEGRLNGHTGCNQFNGGYELSEGRLLAGPLRMTKRACLDMMTEEQLFLAVLRGQPELLVRGDSLTLFTPEGRLVFVDGGALTPAEVARPDTTAVLPGADTTTAVMDTEEPRPEWPDTAQVVHGMFAYLADAALFIHCADGRRYPVAMEEDYLNLERAYLDLVGESAGQRVLLTARAGWQERPAMEGSGAEKALIVHEVYSLTNLADCTAEREVLSGPCQPAGNSYLLEDCATGKFYPVQWHVALPFAGQAYIQAEGVWLPGPAPSGSGTTDHFHVLRIIGWEAGRGGC
jgi:heat shock protein HslJ